jgi:hypothetical protein
VLAGLRPLSGVRPPAEAVDVAQRAATIRNHLLSAFAHWRLEDVLDVWIDVRKLQFFDLETGSAIRA